MGRAQSTAAVWQPRPSGALAAEAWSSPTATGSYPAGAGNYGSQYRAENPWAPAGAPFTGAQQTGQFGGAPYNGYGQAAGFGYAGMPPASTVNAAAPAGGGVATTPRKGRKTALVVAAAVVLALGAGFGAGVAGAHVGNSASATDSSLNQQTTSPVVSDSQPVATGSVEAVAAKLLPSVVSILSVSSSEEAEGSGVILSVRRAHPHQQPRDRRRHRP